MAADPHRNQQASLRADAVPTAEFVRRLRHRAETAAEAAVHHAELSERYHELSRRLSRLAEQAGSTDVAALRQSVEELEAAAPIHESFTSPPSPATLPVHARIATPADLLKASATEDGFQYSGGVDRVTNFVNRDEAASAPAPGPRPAKLKPNSVPTARRARRIQTRALIERFRSVRLVARRVRIRAKKSDLQPKQRTAAEELKQGKNSILTAGTVLAVCVGLLSLVRWQVERDPPLDPIVCSFADKPSEEPQPQPVETSLDEPGEQQETPVEEVVEERPEEIEEIQDEAEPEADLNPQPPEMESFEPKMDTAADQPDAPRLKTDAGPPTESPVAAEALAGDFRSAASRAALLQKYGGTAASESAVQRALDWLVSVQHAQGYWNFNAVGPSGAAGTVHNPIGGTAYALLPFLAAGQTHRAGRYRRQVEAGLTYLSRIGVQTPAGYDLRGMINKQSSDKEPNEAYYVHGAATLVLCEAYGMTRDRRLKAPAEGAVRFLINSQDPRGGGWRYNPHQPGSTSVTVIQVMALMAARKAGLQVPESVFDGVRHYLNSVQVDGEGRYGYEIQKKRYTGAVTAMALLCRMYLGRDRTDGDLRAGVRLLDKAGPYDNLYSLYFATQVMKNWGGAEWERWNARLRDDLIAAQETEGPAAGSWKPRTGAIHAKQGGRLLTTSLATLTLQVYYRYQPLLPEPTAAASTAPDP